MSTRNLRKFMQSKMQKKTQPVEETLEDFEPQYAKKATSAFAGLELSSPSHSEAEESGIDEDMETAVAASARRKRNNKKKKTKPKKDSDGAGPSTSGLDEVERSVREVNEMLGEPTAAPDVSISVDRNRELLKIDAKYLDFNEEYRRRFGPDPEEERTRKRTRNPSSRRMIAFSKDRYEISIKGLRMILIHDVDGVKYFKYSYNQEYAQHLTLLMRVLKRRYDPNIRDEPNIFMPHTLESLFENLTLYFEIDKTSTAINALETTIYFLQSIVEQSFNYFDGKTRLEYKQIENRLFHVALLKYVYVLTNKACHRTALEVAKIMLNLDPSDPLAVIFIIDTLAIRAREYSWLLDLYKYWDNERDASKLFHMVYSVALAKWHIAMKTKKPEDMKAADEQLIEAIEKFPNVVCMIMTFTDKKNQVVMSHELFSKLSKTSTSPDLQALQRLYVKLTYYLWREPGLMEWLTEKALQIVTQYNTDIATRERVNEYGRQRAYLLRIFSLEVRRHLHTISSMSEFISEGHVPEVEHSYTFNPYPSEGMCVDRMRYYVQWGLKYPIPDTQCPVHVIRSFIRSLLPEVPENQGG